MLEVKCTGLLAADGSKSWLSGKIELTVTADGVEFAIPKEDGEPYIWGELPMMDLLTAIQFLGWEIPNLQTLMAMQEHDTDITDCQEGLTGGNA